MLGQFHLDQLQKLVDALYMEDFCGFRHHCTLADSWLVIELNQNEQLLLSCLVSTGLRPYRLQNSRVFVADTAGLNRTAIEPGQLMHYLVRASWWPESNRDLALTWWQQCFEWIEQLPQLAVRSAALSGPALAISEGFALIADRPFHPFAHAKGELATLLSAGLDEGVVVHWWAFKTDKLISRSEQQPVALLLSRSQQADIDERLGAKRGGYLALPLLATQHQRLLAADQDGAAINLAFSSCVGQPTSSLRTLFCNSDSHIHLKLATNARTLGAIRSMPPRYLINGDEACALLNCIREQQPQLKATLQLCDEQAWWVVGDHDSLIDNPGEFGCQLRYLPDNGQDHYIAMSALSYHHHSLWQQVLGADIDEWQCLTALTAQFIDTFLALWCQGVMPECHGQNVLAQYQGDKLVGFVLRDHDTLRVCPGRLKRRCLYVPDYQIDWSTPNSLVLDSEAQLLAYFTTLGIQVNLYPVALAVIARNPHYSEADFWLLVKQEISKFIALPGDKQQAQILAAELLDGPSWPFKQLLTPLLNQQRASTGMPSAMARIDNPLLGLG